MEWFQTNEFMGYLKEQFPEPMSNHFTYDMTTNLIEYIIEQFDDNKYLAYTLSEIIPEITEEEILKFCAK